ncbi:MAG: acireductone dioxygenase, partial [Myxococcota bacterium]
MATLTIKDTDHTTSDPDEIRAFLDRFGIWYQRFEDLEELPEGATDEEILAAYEAPIQAQKESGGYVTADVINIVPTIPNLDVMLAKFEREHWHEEDEVRFIVKG